ncbi:MAG: pseudouridine-5'-phosphate glycosidase [Acidobacteria bacterium]|nr:pseudouridine-5'-phosphate glycosidase [Acidobacteriota bacterium]
MKINFSDEVSGAIHFDRPVVALESTVIAHGLPYPQNIETAHSLELIVRDAGATAATIAIFAGEIFVGLTHAQLELLAAGQGVRKVSRRDFAVAVAKKLNGATTVATTAFVARGAGIKVFATGGIGGVHRGDEMDVSADLPEMANTPIIVVCSGAKSVLDLGRTREWLETNGVTVLGWRCDEMPAFYTKSSGFAVDERVETASQAAEIAAARNELGLNGAILVCAAVPERAEIALADHQEILNDAIRLADSGQIKGKDTTPFLLARMAELSGGRTLSANIALLENNARVAAEIAAALSY